MNISPIRKRKLTDEDKEEVWKKDVLNKVFLFTGLHWPTREDFVQAYFEKHPCRCPTCEFTRDALFARHAEGRLANNFDSMIYRRMEGKVPAPSER